MIFSTEEAKLLRSALIATWQQIAPDVEAMCDSDNEVAVEACIDADRLTLNCGYGKKGAQDGKDAQQLLRSKFAQYGYTPVLKQLATLVTFF